MRDNLLIYKPNSTRLAGRIIKHQDWSERAKSVIYLKPDLNQTPFQMTSKEESSIFSGSFDDKKTDESFSGVAIMSNLKEGK